MFKYRQFIFQGESVLVINIKSLEYPYEADLIFYQHKTLFELEKREVL